MHVLPSRFRADIRSMMRISATALFPELQPSSLPVGAYWWTGAKNFGDLLTPFLLRRHGFAPILREQSEAELFAVGSVIHHTPAGFRGLIWGSGLPFADRTLDLTDARVLLVRGRLTAAAAGRHDIPLGDPGLILGDHLRSHPAARHDVGIVPHLYHRSANPDIDRLSRMKGSQVINVQRHPLLVAHQIAQCRAVLTTSLHGLIVADSLGIPAVWAMANPSVPGGEFKFCDHESVMGLSVDLEARRVALEDIRTPAQLHHAASTPPVHHVVAAKESVLTSLEALRRELSSRKSLTVRLVSGSQRSRWKA